MMNASRMSVSMKEGMKQLTLGLYLALSLLWVNGVAWAQEERTTGTLDEPTLLGTYLSSPFTIEELALQGFDKDDICGNSGTFVMALRPGGWSLDNYPLPGCTAWNPPIVGSWRLLENNALAITELQDTGCGTQEYTYSWRLEGNTLMLSALDDPCTVRIYFFTAHLWRKIPEGAQPVFR